MVVKTHLTLTILFPAVTFCGNVLMSVAKTKPTKSLVTQTAVYTGDQKLFSSLYHVITKILF